MRYAIVSDIHANIRAWDAVLADLRAQGAEVVVCLGDVVGYGPKPAEALEAVRAVTNHFVMGNHDAAAVGIMDYSIFNNHARQAIEWTMTALSPEAKEFLASVPLAIEAGEIFFVHAEISEPGRFDYIDTVKIAEQNFAGNEHFVSFLGHTHLPKIFEKSQDGSVRELLDQSCALDPNKRYIINVGSVGEPRNPDDLRARYVIYDSETREVDFRRVDFDIVAYRADLESTTLALRPYFLRVYEQVIEGREVVVSNGGSLVDMRVSHDSASLVNPGHARVVQFTHSGLMLASAKPSHTPLVILGAVAALALSAFAYWVFGSNRTTSSGQEAEVVVEKKIEKKPPPPEKVKPIAKKPIEPIAALPKPVHEVNIPEPKIPEKKPTPQPTPQPDPPAPKPQTPIKKPNQPIQTAWWRMEKNAEEGPLIDQSGQVKLIPIAKARAISAIAPDPVPLNQVENQSALLDGIWQEEKSTGVFALTADSSFTFEGWFATKPTRRPIFLLGTRTGDGEDNRGWHIDLRPPSRGRREGQMCFFYDQGHQKIQALADAVTVADSKPHHFAAVWNHDSGRGDGEMKLYLDGLEVASATVPLSDVHGTQIHPLRIGAEVNPKLLALDELRYTRRALAPHEFLLKTPVLGVTMIKSDPQSRDSWSVPENWEGGEVPSGDDNIIIGESLQVQILNSPPKPYTGSLVLQKNSQLQLWSSESEAALPTPPALLVLHENAQLILRSGRTTLGPIEMVEQAQIFGGISTGGHGSIRTFKGQISGNGKLILNGVNRNIFRLEVANTFTGGLQALSTQNQPFHLVAAADAAFGTGDVEIQDHCSLVIEPSLKNTIADTATLSLRGPGSLRVLGAGADANQLYKLVLNSNETVSGFVIDGEDQGEGTFSSQTHPIIAGPGKLKVERHD